MIVLFKLLLAGVTLVLLYVKYIKKSKRYIQMGKRIPGPPTIPVLGNVLLFGRDPSKALDISMNLCDKYKYGPVALWIFNELNVITTDPNDVQLLLQANSTKTFIKSWHYSTLYPIMGNGLFTCSDFNMWKANRKIIVPSFHTNYLKGFISIFFDEASILINKIKPEMETDVREMVGLCALDIICRTAMGVKTQCQSGKGENFVNGLVKILQIIHMRALRVWLINDYIFKWTSLIKEHNEACDTVLSFAENVIKKKKQLIESRKIDNIDDNKTDAEDPGVFLNIMLGDGPEGNLLSDEQLRDETVTLIIGAQETTTTEITFTMLMLALHQNVQQQVLQEIDNVFQSDKRKVPSYDELQQLHLLERVIKETMRLYPSVPIFGRSLTDDIDMNGYTLPKGCTAFVFVHGLHRNPHYFPNPHEFNPDNFLPERCRERSPYAFSPFGAGLRNCIGQKYAMLQMKTLLSTLLRNYSLSIGGNIRRMEDIELKVETTLKSLTPIKIIFSAR